MAVAIAVIPLSALRAVRTTDDVGRQVGMGQVDAGVDDRHVDAGALVQLIYRLDALDAGPHRLVGDLGPTVRGDEADYGVRT